VHTVCLLCLHISIYFYKYKLATILHVPILYNGRSVKVHVLVGRALLKRDFFTFEFGVSEVTEILVLLLVGGTSFRSTFFC